MLFSNFAYSAVLRDIDSASDEEKTFTTISFDTNYGGKHTMKNEGSFLEMILPGVTVEQPGDLHDAKSPSFTKNCTVSTEQ